ncbi:solute carrier family 35 member F1-like isoform X2 [Sesamum indicum]|uniref:Solute carrier family 35 member F1-like isoform X2 n=1 Tax=Sesamum indicum TaxID=4182 RepID=A0A6I9UJ87_SESIN|nr:solute carrier family 35 member F1-like isoform X2 [Sesamum indicum]
MSSSSCLWINRQGMARTSFLLFLGQAVSLSLATSSFAISLITNQGVHTPLTLSFFTYMVLALVYGSIMLYRRHKLLVPWYCVTILDCWTIAWAIILTRLVLGTRYSLWQFFGAGVCLVGLGLVILSDSNPGVGGGPKPLYGDILVIAATVFLAMSNIGVEFCVKKKDRVEVVTMVSVFGMLVTASGMATLERKSLRSISWSPQLVLAYVGNTTASFIFYTLGPFVLKMSGATLFNLSLLTSDMWAVLIKLFIYKQQVNWLYYSAYALVAVGIFIYSKTERDPDITQVVEDGNTSPECSPLIEENADIRNGTLLL